MPLLLSRRTLAGEAGLVEMEGAALSGVLVVALVVAFVVVLLRRVRRGGASGGTSGELKIAFVHPDLGIGGAERLIVDAAVGLQRLGHRVVVYTAHHSVTHCFEETRDGTLEVVTYGDWLPKKWPYAFCAYARVCYVALRLGLGREAWDVVVADQVSICVPLLKWVCRPRGTVFYCHYPDKLLCSARASFFKRLYRLPLDWAEEETTGAADVVLVNSRFTAATFGRAFRRLAARGLAPDVLYPALNLEAQDAAARDAARAARLAFLEARDEAVLVSLNRFERKKNVGLAVRAFAKLPERLRRRTRLVLAGVDLPSKGDGGLTFRSRAS